MNKIETALHTGDNFAHDINGQQNIPISMFNDATHPAEIKCHNEFEGQFEITETENLDSIPEDQYQETIYSEAYEEETNSTNSVKSFVKLFQDDDSSDDSEDLLLNIAMNIGKQTDKKIVKLSCLLPQKPKVENKKVQELSNLINTWQHERCSWDEYFSCIALLISSRSPSERLKVGSVIVKDNRIISAGYNGFPSGTPHVSIMRDSHEQNTIHAEQNAIADAARRGVSIQDSTIYITHRPCINCAKFIISSGITKIKYLSDYRNDDLVDQLLNASNISIEKV